MTCRITVETTADNRVKVTERRTAGHPDHETVVDLDSSQHFYVHSDNSFLIEELPAGDA